MLPNPGLTQFPAVLVQTERLGGAAESPRDLVNVGNTLYGSFASGKSSNYFFLDGGQLQQSADNGLTWTPNGFFSGKHILHLGYFSNNLFVVEYEKHDISSQFAEQNLRIYRSVDGGISFAVAHEIKDTTVGNPPYNYIKEGIFREVNGVLFLTYRDNAQGTAYLHSYYSTDAGLSWAKTTMNNFGVDNLSNLENKISGSEGWFFYNIGFTNYILAAQQPDFSDLHFISFPDKDNFIEAYSINGQFIAFADQSTYTSTDWLNSAALQSSSSPAYLACLLKDGYFNLFDRYGGFYRAPATAPTNANLQTFQPYTYTNSYPPDFRAVGNELYLLGITSLRSSDNGLSWNAPPTGSQVFSSYIQRHQNLLWMQPGFLYRSMDGLNWSHFQPNGLPPQTYDWSNMADLQGKLFVTGGSSFNDKVFRSDDGGANWSEVFDHPGSGFSRVVADVNQQKLYYLFNLSTTTELYISSDQGTSWQQINDPNPPFDAFVAKGDTIFFVDPSVLHYSYDAGGSWQNITFNADMGPSHQNDLILTGDGRLIVSNRVNKYAYLSTDWGQSFSQTLQAPSYFRSLTQLDSLSVFNLNSWPYSSNGVYISNNAGVSGVTFQDSAWLNASSFLIEDGYLYGSGYPFKEVVRTELQPLLDGLQYQQFGTALVDIYLDRNQNCLHDPGEEGVPEQTVVFQPGNFLAATGTDGLIRRVLPTQSYNLQLQPYAQAGVSPCQNLSNIPISTGSVNALNIAFDPQPYADLSLELAPIGLRPGFEGDIIVVMTNKGVQPVAGGATLQINFPADTVLYLSASPAAGSVTNHSVEFVLPDIGVFASVTFKVHIAITPNPDLINHFIPLQANLLAPYTDGQPNNHHLSRYFRLTGSYDPNDKTAFTASPNGELSITDKKLTYLIRFQNTGSDTAFNVIVADTLSNWLDWSSLEMLSASHPYRITVDDPGVVRWRFDNILLPDSSTNEPASHGYVLFRIAAKNNLLVGDTLTNQASIYFDINRPVLTNMTKTAVFNPAASGTKALWNTASSLGITPNPVHDQLYWTMHMVPAGIMQAAVYDQQGRLVQTLLQNWQDAAVEIHFQHALQNLPAGNYRLVVRVNRQQWAAPFIVQ